MIKFLIPLALETLFVSLALLCASYYQKPLPSVGFHGEQKMSFISSHGVPLYSGRQANIKVFLLLCTDELVRL